MQFLHGHLGSAEVAIVDAHLDRCNDCVCVVLEALSSCEVMQPSSQGSSSRYFAFEPGSLVAGRYLVRCFIGQGGMGDVYAALDCESGLDVALKTARARNCDDPAANRRLAREFELASRVRHPNVCRVLDLGVHCDYRPRNARLSYFTMDLVHGQSLAEQLKEGPLARDAFPRMASDLLSGVSAIHSAGIIHRDIKSHNLMLPHGGTGSIDGTGRITLVDFGLATEAAKPARSVGVHEERSGSFSLEGSPAYMAPEQFWGTVIRPATDVFACGVVMFQALTGAFPFRSLSSDNRSRAQRDPMEPPLRASTLARDIPSSWDNFIARCLDIDVDQRYADGTQAAASLSRIVSSASP